MCRKSLIILFNEAFLSDCLQNYANVAETVSGFSDAEPPMAIKHTTVSTT